MIEIDAPHNRIQSLIHISGSKSLSNRLLLLNAVVDLHMSFTNLSDSEDTRILQEALQQIKSRSTTLIDVKHAGTDMRFLTAYLAITSGEWILTGSDRMKQRPIGELVKTLKLLGADITYLEKENYPPLLIKGKKLKGGQVEIDASISSQFVSALLLIAPALENGLTLNLKGESASKPYINMTIGLLEQFGIICKQSQNTIHVSKLPLKPFLSNFNIESDWSSASYWFSVCALAKNASIELSQFHKTSLQADSILPELYKDLGVKTEFKSDSILLSSIPVNKKELSYDCRHCPDIAQTLAVTCLGLHIKCRLTGLSTLKIKETDRLLALKTELEKYGAKVEIGPDYLYMSLGTDDRDKIRKKNLEAMDKNQEARIKKQETRNKQQETINTYQDHRMAMSFAPLALIYGKVKMDDPSVVGKSYPSFWEDLKSLGFNVDLLP